MGKLLLLFLFHLPLLAKAQGNFSITGYGKHLKNGDKIFLSYKQGDKFIYDSTTVVSNRYELKGKFTSVARGYISRNANPLYAEMLHDTFNIYIESGKISLNSPDSLNNSVISGTVLNNDNALLISNLKQVELEGRLQDISDLSPSELKDTAVVNSLKAKSMEHYHRSNLIKLAFIQSHPDSYVSLYNLLNISKSSKYLQDVERCYKLLNPMLKNSVEGKEIARRISEGNKTTIGLFAKDFTQPDINGKEVKLSDYKGKYVLVDFWASWCLPCREENPNVIAAYNRYLSKNFTVLGISVDVLSNKQNWLKAIKEDQLPWEQLSDLKKENEAAKLYGITTIPANVLIDPTGKIIGKDLKGKELRDKLITLFGN